MPQRDFFHQLVKGLLIQDGWIITADPYYIGYGQERFFIDLGAEKLIAAEKNSEKIAVEVKSFLGKSHIKDLELAIGQYSLYLFILKEKEPERTIFLAVPLDVYENVLNSPLGSLISKNIQLNLLVFNPEDEVLVHWLQEKK